MMNHAVYGVSGLAYERYIIQNFAIIDKKVHPSSNPPFPNPLPIVSFVLPTLRVTRGSRDDGWPIGSGPGEETMEFGGKNRGPLKIGWLIGRQCMARKLALGIPPKLAQDYLHVQLQKSKGMS